MIIVSIPHNRRLEKMPRVRKT